MVDVEVRRAVGASGRESDLRMWCRHDEAVESWMMRAAPRRRKNTFTQKTQP